jgi:tetratricopeptide (TPR) repeat protein
VRDAAYSMLTEEDRILGHRLAAEWLEGAGEPDALVLAEHYERGVRPQNAVRWYHRAAEQALDANDWGAALERAERGLACGADDEVRGALRLIMTQSHSWLGDSALAQAYGLEAIQQLPPGSDGWYDALGEVAVASGQLADNKVLVGIVDELLALAPAPEQVPAHLRTLVRGMQRLLIAGSYELAGSVLGTITRLETLLEAGLPAVDGWVQQAHAWWALYSGDPGDFLERMDMATRCFESAGDLRQACLRRSGQGYGLMEIGDFEGAERTLREAIDAASRMGLHSTRALAEHNLGYALARKGHLEEALRVERHALELLAQQADRRLHGAGLKYLARILLQTGDLPAAERAARQALDLVAELPTVHSAILATLARVLLAGNRRAEAVETAEHAMRMLESLYDEGEAYVRLTFAEALHAVGKLTAAQTAIGFARDRLLARAERIRNASWRRSFLERVPENARTLLLASAWTNDEAVHLR